MQHWKEGSATLALAGLLATSAQAAAPLCTTPTEMSALRTAALQQQLMVAGLTCQATRSYNRFVLAYRPELQRSDAELKAYFIRRSGEHGEADYDSFKTKLANLSSLSDVAQPEAYCRSARMTFEMAMHNHESLARFVAGQTLVVTLPEQLLCRGPRFVETAQADPNVEVDVPLHSAPPQISTAPIAVGGVPSHALPATPYGDGSEVAEAPPPLAAPGVAEPSPASSDSDAQPAYQAPQPSYAADDDPNAPDNSYGDADAPPPPPSPPPHRRIYGAPAWPPGWGQFPWGRRYGYRYYRYYYGR